MTSLVPAGSHRSVSPVSLGRARVSRHLSRHLPYYLTPEEAHLVIDAAKNERDRLLLTPLWQTGARISEAIAINLGDLSRAGIRVLGKGIMERVIFVQDSLVSSVLLYAQERRLERGDYLIPSRKGDHITKQRADQIIKAAARQVPGITLYRLQLHSYGLQSIF